MIRILKPLGAAIHSVRLEGTRVYLRPPVERDWSDWSRLRERSRSFLSPWEPTWPSDALTRDSYRRRLRRNAEEWRDGQAYSLFIFTKSEDALVGGVTLSNLRRGVAQMGSLGYWIGEPFVRQGYMTEALSCVIRFAFHEIDLHRLEAACLPDNAASNAVLRKCGFRQEGFARKYLKINGDWHDHVLFALLREEAVFDE